MIQDIFSDIEQQSIINNKRDFAKNTTHISFSRESITLKIHILNKDTKIHIIDHLNKDTKIHKDHLNNAIIQLNYNRPAVGRSIDIYKAPLTKYSKSKWTWWAQKHPEMDSMQTASVLIVRQQLPTQDIAANILKQYGYIDSIKTAIPTWWQYKSKAKGPHPIICDASNRNRSMFCRSRNQPKKYRILPKLTNKTILILSILKHRTNCSIPIQKTTKYTIPFNYPIVQPQKYRILSSVRDLTRSIQKQNKSHQCHSFRYKLKHNSLNTIWLHISSATNSLIQSSNYLNIFCISCQYICSRALTSHNPDVVCTHSHYKTKFS